MKQGAGSLRGKKEVCRQKAKTKQKTHIASLICLARQAMGR
jgi:hypothetical protein